MPSMTVEINKVIDMCHELTKQEAQDGARKASRRKTKSYRYKPQNTKLWI